MPTSTHIPAPLQPSLRSTPSLSSNPPPERSPLEPAASYHRRLTKWKHDNAKWEGQRRAVQSLDAKKTPIPVQQDQP